VVSPGYLKENNIPLPDGFTSNDTETIVFVIINNELAGYIALSDEIRPESADAIKILKENKIKSILLTGDNNKVAASVSKTLGLDNFFAEVLPHQKLEKIKELQSKGEFVAMTGDGVNDAPSLVEADLGIAMGKIGTEVAKEASDIVLLDDNFASIVAAIEEGRNIYRTIKKVILYLFATSFGEVLTITGALLLGMPLPILPAQIVWLNFVTDGFLVVTFSMEPKDENILKEKFEESNNYLLDYRMFRHIILLAFPMMIGTLALFSQYYALDITKAWTISLTVLAAFNWLNAWNVKSGSKSLFRTNPFENKFLLLATFIVIVLQLFAIYNPVMQTYLRTTALSVQDWMLIIPIAFSIVVVEEVRKFFYRRNHKKELLS
jgi:magnesium-transporting ATPase (P-type)